MVPEERRRFHGISSLESEVGLQQDTEQESECKVMVSSDCITATIVQTNTMIVSCFFFFGALRITLDSMLPQEASRLHLCERLVATLTPGTVAVSEN